MGMYYLYIICRDYVYYTNTYLRAYYEKGIYLPAQAYL